MSTNPIILPDRPAIEGLSFRSIRGEEDADAIYAVRAGCIARDQVDLLSTSEGLPGREDIRAALAQIVAAQEQNQRLVAQVNAQVVGYSLVDAWYENDGRWVYLILGWVLPEWRGRGIGTALLHWGERTARQLAAEQHPNEPFEFAANASSTQPEATALLLHEGYSAGYTVLEMQLDNSALPPVSPLPAGAEVRPVLPEHYPLIADSIGEAYRNEYAGGRFQEAWNLDESVARLSAPRQNPALWQIAWDGQQVVGQVTPLIENGRALMYDISVRPAWRRKGLARALLTRALWDLRGRGEQVIRLNTVAEFRTRARDLYRSVGFRVLKEFPRYRKSPYDIEHLRSAIVLARQAREHGNHPFGAVLVDDHNHVLLQAENTVVTERDCTGHAETNLVRLATQRFSPEQLARCTLYSSTEPCAMCAGAIHWSQIGRVVYALSEVDLYAIIGPSPEHLFLPCRQVFAHSQRSIDVVGPVSASDAEARAVHENFWTRQRQDGDA